MSSQAEYDQIYAKRLAAIEKEPTLTVLSSMNQPRANDAGPATQYIVYTDFKQDAQKHNSYTISVFTPYENVDKYGHAKADFQSQLLFDWDRWRNNAHITVLETLGSESRLAFYDFQNMGLAQLAIKAFVNLAKKADIATIDGNISSFDKENFAKLNHIFTKHGFTFATLNEAEGIGRIQLTLA
ncbi:hypothetical protein [Lacticaseibacillus nasuensis]|uniref:Uncharacterized protein n=1 Tax=Lacticaseibacillus nasuensis JCM 17158 TaxID=1291734 RepID=A0A0R1JMA3_9LACO|nr:hypothetical protein [Lacticaseibacillus nasuensis]KRK72463.1 hypothetical protein FD02_GL001435 [Lacticaseibacillus nasuensis JCM 17158]MCX2456453.1 hypothetical protein [Lacticaseibacillus nasuensis]